jgi:hypothetical protein
MSKIMRVAVLAMSLVSLFAVMSSTAGATTWTNTGQSPFTATAPAGTLSSTGSSLNCASATATGVTNTASGSFGVSIGHGTISFASCRLGGTVPTVHCTYTLTADSTVGGVTEGAVDVTCGVFIASRENCHIEGRVPATYHNGTAGPPVMPGQLTVRHSVADLVVTNGSGGGTCALGSNDRGTLTALTFTVTGGTGPILVTD